MGGTELAQPVAGPDSRHGLLVLSHPLVAALLALWFVNDHVLKAAYGTWWTGKLSDVVGLIIFPLLVAAAVERFVQRPLAIGVGSTAILFGAINLWAPADAATERLLNLGVASELTQDLTDLLVLPALFGASWMWHRPLRSWRAARLAWGRIVFGFGALTSMATSQATNVAELHEGTLVLTPEEPSVAIPVSLLLDGDEAEDLGPLEVASSLAFFGEDPGVDYLDAVSVETIDDGDGSGDVVFRLIDLATGPVEVMWRISAVTFGEGGFLIFGGEPADPVVLVDAPPDDFGPAPLASLSVQREYGRKLRIWEVVVDVESGDAVRFSVPTWIDSTGISVATEDEVVTLEPGFGAELRAPESCSNPRCRFSIWVSHNGDAMRIRAFGEGETIPDNSDVRVDGPEGTVVVELIEHEPVVTTRTFMTETVVWDSPGSRVFVGELDLPVPMTAVEQATSFFHLETAPVVHYTGDSEGVSVHSNVEMDGIGWFGYNQLEPIEDCCPAVNVLLESNVWSDDGEDPDASIKVEAIAEVMVELWTLHPVEEQIRLTFE